MNIGRILVALDGSRLAETIMPAARSLAETLDAKLILVHELERDPPREVHGEPHLATAEEAYRYLDELAEGLRRSGVACEMRVAQTPADDVAAALDLHARELGADLIAMCAHGRSNMRDRVVGRIAERTLRRGETPILLRTARRPDVPEFALRNVLTPIELGHDVDAALDASRTIAAAYGATVTLLTVPEPGAAQATRLLPGASALAYEFKREDAREHLDRLAERLRADVPGVRPVVVDGRPAEAIVQLGEALPADLVVLVTHARTGFSSWYEPGTAQQLLSRPDLTLLLLKQP